MLPALLKPGNQLQLAAPLLDGERPARVLETSPAYCQVPTSCSWPGGGACVR